MGSDEAKANDGRPDVFDVRCPDCGWLNVQASNGSFLHVRCQHRSCKKYYSGYIVDGVLVCIEGSGRSRPIMASAPPTMVG